MKFLNVWLCQSRQLPYCLPLHTPTPPHPITHKTRTHEYVQQMSNIVARPVTSWTNSTLIKLLASEYHLISSKMLVLKYFATQQNLMSCRRNFQLFVHFLTDIAMTEVVGCTADDWFQPTSTVIGISPIPSSVKLFPLQTDWPSHALQISLQPILNQHWKNLTPSFVSGAACPAWMLVFKSRGTISIWFVRQCPPN